MRLGGISNKNIKNIIKQNQDVLYALDENGLDNNIYTFYINKIISRLKQFVQKPKCKFRNSKYFKFPVLKKSSQDKKHQKK